MNILFIHDKPSGGAGESLFQIINTIWDKHECFVVFSTGGFLKEKFNQIKDRVPSYYTHFEGSWLLNRKFKPAILNYLRLIVSLPKRFKTIRYLLKRIKEDNIDVVYSNTIYLIEGAIAAKIAGKPHFWQVRELYDLDYYNYCLPKTGVTKVLKYFSKKIVCNSYRTQEVVTGFGVSQENTVVLYNIVNPFDESLDIRKKLGLSSEIKIVCILGWITPNKMVEDFIAVANRFINSDAKFLIIGGFGGKHAYNNKIKELLDESPNKSNIIHAGLIPNAVNYLKSIDILLCPCYTESFGRTVAEALMAGVPAIGIRGSATQELIQHNKSGFMVEKSDIEGMATHVRLLLENDNQRLEFGRNGQAYVQSNLSSKILKIQYNNLFEKLK